MPKVRPHSEFFELKKNPSPTLCRVKGCRTARCAGRTLCHRHRMEKWRKMNPLRMEFQSLKDRAKLKKHRVLLTFAEFKKFLEMNPSYMEGKGTGREGMHIDRIDVTRQYEVGNLQVLENWENSVKANWYDNAVRRGWLRAGPETYAKFAAAARAGEGKSYMAQFQPVAEDENGDVDLSEAF